MDEIKAGNYIKKESEIRTEHYLVLSVDSEHIEVMKFLGTPIGNVIIHHWEDVTEKYSVDMIWKNDVKIENLYDEYQAKRGLSRKVFAGARYTWNDIELFVPCPDYVCTEKGLVEMDKTFYGELIKSAQEE